MRRPFQFLTLLVVAIAGWIQRDQQAAIVCVFGQDAIFSIVSFRNLRRFVDGIIPGALSLG